MKALKRGDLVEVEGFPFGWLKHYGIYLGRAPRRMAAKRYVAHGVFVQGSVHYVRHRGKLKIINEA